MKKYNVLILVVCLLCSSAVYSQRGSQLLKIQQNVTHTSPIYNEAQMDSFVLATMEEHHIPGVAACIVRDGKLIWIGTYGYADFEKNLQVNDSTAFILGQISQSFTATALMQLWERGLFGLDDNINNYFPPGLQVVNPHHPGNIITPRMTLGQTSSIAGNSTLIDSYFTWGYDSPVSQYSYLVDYLVPGGQYYSVSSYNTWAPGTQYGRNKYANTLNGYLAGSLSDTSFSDYCKDYIFKPLNMNNTGWFLADIDTNNLAMGYEYSGGQFHPFGYLGHPAYSVFLLKASITDMSHFLIAFMESGNYNGNRILDSSTVNLMMTAPYPQVDPEQGLGWFMYDYFLDYFGTKIYYGHDGYTYGCRAGFDFLKDENLGVVILANVEQYQGVGLIWDQLYIFGDTYKRIHASKTDLSSTYIKPGVDTLTITSKIENPFNHNAQVDAHITSIDSTYVTTLSMFDDGMHSDGHAADNVWGTYLEPLTIENEFTVGISATDLDSSDYHISRFAARFTSIGPIVYEGYVFFTADTTINKGEYFTFQLKLGNEGASTTATNITAQVTCLDTNATILTASLGLGDIVPGETVTSTGVVAVEIGDDCPDYSTIFFDIHIYSNGYHFWSDSFSVTVLPTGIAAEGEEHIPTQYALSQNFPNPFNPTTSIEFSLPKSDYVTLKVYNMLGEEVATLVSDRLTAGNHRYIWNAIDFPSGIYYYKFKAGEYVQTRKLVLLK